MEGCPPDITDMQCYLITLGLNLAYVMLAVTALASIVFPLVYIVRNPREAKMSVVGILVLALLFFICYSMASGDLSYRMAQQGITENQAQLVGGGIMMMYVLGAAAVVGLIASEVRSVFK